MDKKSKKKLLFVTGTRADFGKLEPLATEAFRKGFSITFFITGMHMLNKYGLTKEEVRNHKDFELFEFLNQREGDEQDVILSKTILGFSDYLNEINPDMVIIHGDRLEAIACAIVCATNYFLSVHVEGGEVSGTVDEIFRHCNTKLCHLHMVSSEKAKQRVLQLGEPKQNIFVIGSPELDVHSKDSGVTIKEVKNRYGIKFEEYGICIFHPVTSELENIELHTKIFFNALRESGKNYVVILPNNDPGSEIIRLEIDKLDKIKFKVLPSMRFRFFSELMKNCSIFVGNSSAGVREVPFLGISSIDVGSRQFNRSINKSIQSVDSLDQENLLYYLKKNWNKKFKKNFDYGYGNAAELFSEILLKEEIWNKSLQKNFKDT